MINKAVLAPVVLSAAFLGGCAYAPTDPRSGNSTMSCGPENDPVIVELTKRIKDEFRESLGGSSDNGGSVSVWRPKDDPDTKDLRFVTITRHPDGQTCIAGNYTFYMFLPK